MQAADKESSLKTLQEIHSIMDRSARFLSLSGWSGVWAGSVALAGAWIAHGWQDNYSPATFMQFVLLALAVLVVAILGGYFFTARKARSDGHQLWNTASRQLVTHMAIPLAAGGLFSYVLVVNGDVQYIAPACLLFYGLALINGSKYTLSDIKYLGLLQLLLGAACLFMPGYGLYFWAIGFGVLHIVYGVIMWNKYDKHRGE